MDRHFTLPAIIAASVHAGLFFGFPHRAKLVDLAPVPSPLEPHDVISITQDSPKTAEEDQANAGSGGVPLPSLVDVPRPSDSATFSVQVEVDPSTTKAIGPVTKIDGISGPPGPGTVAGPYVPVTIASSDLLDNPPRARFQMSPQYPAAARSDGRDGEVTVEFVVDEQGRVLSPRVVSSTDAVFDGPALQAIAKWRFEPGTVHNHVVKFRMAVPIVFRLNE